MNLPSVPSEREICESRLYPWVTLENFTPTLVPKTAHSVWSNVTGLEERVIVDDTSTFGLFDYKNVTNRSFPPIFDVKVKTTSAKGRPYRTISF